MMRHWYLIYFLISRPFFLFNFFSFIWEPKVFSVILWFSIDFCYFLLQCFVIFEFSWKIAIRDWSFSNPVFLYFFLNLYRILSNFAWGTIFFWATVDFWLNNFFLGELKYLIQNQRLLKKIWFLRQSYLEYHEDLEKNIKT